MANSEAKKEANKRYRATTRKVNKIRMQITIEQHAEIKHPMRVVDLLKQ